MFTGLIEDVGTLEGLRRGADQVELTIATNLPMADLTLGESIAVNGVCLTVTRFGGGRFSADVSPETLDKTSLGQLRNRSRVNLERALRLSDRLGGHLVTGHVDGLGTLTERRQEANAWFFRIQADPQLMQQMVAKGSIAIDGISLTVNEVADDSFTVMIIPHTLQMTTLNDAVVGARVNLETDIIGKYVARLIGGRTGEKTEGVSLDLLAKHGFL